jgi:hypothetical protein
MDSDGRSCDDVQPHIMTGVETAFMSQVRGLQISLGMHA